MITMNEVTKIYETKHRQGWFRTEKRSVSAGKSLSLNIGPGEIVGLLGLNGAGKTTTIRMLSTLLEPSSGNLEVDGMSMSKNRQVIQKR